MRKYFELFYEYIPREGKGGNTIRLKKKKYINNVLLAFINFPTKAFKQRYKTLIFICVQ